MLPGGGREARGEDGLDGVHHEGGGLQGLHLLEDPLERGLGHQEEAAAGDPQPLAAQLDLPLRLLAPERRAPCRGCDRADARLAG